MKGSETNASTQGSLLGGVLLCEVVPSFGAYGGSSVFSSGNRMLLVSHILPAQYKPAQVSVKKTRSRYIV